MKKTITQKYFEELTIGDQIITAKRLITSDDIDSFADLSGDHFYAHMIKTDFNGTMFEEQVAHGYFIMSAAAGLFIDSYEKNPVLLNYGIDELRFTKPMYAGSQLYIRFTCKEKIAQELKDGFYVNLGIGIPTLVANYVPEGIQIEFQSENGILGMGPFPLDGDEDADLINAGKQTITSLPGASFFDSSMSFGMIRGKHVDLTILGAMEVSEKGDIANWKIPGKMVKGMGGAMDLVASAKNIIVAMQHVNKAGESKLLPACTLPLTGIRCVKKIVTELAVLSILPDGGFKLLERAPGVSVETIKKATLGKLIIEGEIPEMAFD